MAELGNRVKETTTTIGTGTLDLDGAPTGFRAFSDEFITGVTVDYLIVDDPDNPTDYEYGIGTFTTGTPNKLSRDLVEGSSNSDNKVSWSAGTKTVVCTPTANRFNRTVKAKTANYTVTLADYDDLITGDSTSLSPETLTITLPTVASAGDGFVVHVKNVGATGEVVVDGNGSETIDGATTLSLPRKDYSVTLTCNGSVWFTISEPVRGDDGPTTLTSTPGTTFSGLPPGVRMIVLALSAVSLDDTDNILIRIGDSGGIVTSGYSASGFTHTTTGGVMTDFTTGFGIGSNVAANSLSGTVTLVRRGNTDIWECAHNLIQVSGAGNDEAFTGGGSLALSNPLDRVQILDSGADNFDSGTIALQYF